MERDAIRKKTKLLQKISTHTLTWSVTQGRGFFTFLFLISTHTLTWSVTNSTVPFVKYA